MSNEFPFDKENNDAANSAEQAAESIKDKSKDWASKASAKADDLKSDVHEKMGQAKEKMDCWQAQCKDKSKQCMDSTCKSIEEKPYQALGIAAVAGLLLGALLGRGCRGGNCR